MLTLYNTLSRRKEVFTPQDPNRVGLYVCGPTVYDFAHIGNARPVVVFDVLARLLRYHYPNVCYVRNITDVDDKINAAALKNKESIADLTQRTAAAYHADMAALGALSPDIEPRATHHIDEMIVMIKKLIEVGHAYQSNGHVLFSVSSFQDYGLLSKRNPEEMLAGARVEVAPYKKDAGDFVLWKPSDDMTPGWESPWGYGRPGWHIECSAMSGKYLGDTFDIHGGGQDLIFPHHENEIAQSRCANGTPVFARYWMHNGHLTIEGDKMSKSLCNFRTVHDLLTCYSGEVIRLALLSTHYRQPLDWTETTLQQSKHTLDRLYTSLRGIEVADGNKDADFLNVLNDDLNIPAALARLHDLASQLNKSTSSAERHDLASTLKSSAYLLGILQQDPEAWFHQETATALSAAQVEDMIEQRKQARVQRDFAKSDSIRKELLEQGIILEDSATGTTWRRA